MKLGLLHFEWRPTMARGAILMRAERYAFRHSAGPFEFLQLVPWLLGRTFTRYFLENYSQLVWARGIYNLMFEDLAMSSVLYKFKLKKKLSTSDTKLTLLQINNVLL